MDSNSRPNSNSKLVIVILRAGNSSSSRRVDECRSMQEVCVCVCVTTVKCYLYVKHFKIIILYFT